MKKASALLWFLVLPYILYRVARVAWHLPLRDRVFIRPAGPVRAELYSPSDPLRVSIDGVPATFTRRSADTIDVQGTGISYERRPTNIVGRPLRVSDRFVNVGLLYPDSHFYIRTATV